MSPEMVTQQTSWNAGKAWRPQRHPLLDPCWGERSDMSTHCTASPCPGCRWREGQAEAGEFLLKVIQTTEWEMPGWLSACVPGRGSAGRGVKSPRLARKAVRTLRVCVSQTSLDLGVICMFCKPIRESQAQATWGTLLHLSRSALGVTSPLKPSLTAFPANTNLRE